MRLMELLPTRFDVVIGFSWIKIPKPHDYIGQSYLDLWKARKERELKKNRKQRN